MACPFCECADAVIAENEHAYVIHDKHPIVKGHLLVIPKKHYESIMGMDREALCGTIMLVKEMEKRLVERMGVKGLTLRQNWSPFLPEGPLVVRHVHFHIIPRELDDGLATGTKRIELKNGEKRRIVNLLK